MWRCATATTGMLQTIGIAERAVGTVKEGDRSGDGAIWRFSNVVATCFGFVGGFSKNITDVDGDSPFNKRYGRGEFKGERVPFGALVDFMH